MSAAPIDVNALGSAGMNALQSGDAKTARALFEKIVDAGKADKQVWLCVALARQAMRDIGATHAAIDEVLKADPTNIRALLIKADCYAAQNDGRAAASYYTTVVRLAPDLAALPPEVAGEIRRAKSACDKYAADMLAHLKAELAQDGYDETVSSRRFTDSLEMLAGAKQRYVEEPKSFYFSGLLPTEFYPREMFPWLGAMEAATDDIAEELAAFIENSGSFRPYVEAEADRPARGHKLLNSTDWGALFLWQDGKLIEENAAQFPKTMAALAHAPLDDIEGRAPMALFSTLTPGTRIDPHTGYLNTRLICHLPIIVPGKCYLRVGNTTHEWKRGEICVFNDTVEHEAWNDSTELRVVLLFSVWRPELTEEERRFASAVVRSAVTFPTSGA